MLKITICDRNPGVIEAFKNTCVSNAEIDYRVGDILTVKCDAFVSPANSFGWMDGGVDYAYSTFFGWDLQKRLQSYLELEPFGELLVGRAFIVPTLDERVPYLISAPTMRVPMRISDAADIYLATRAAVAAAVKGLLAHIAFPGMGTGCGEVRPEVAANAMLKGIAHAVNGSPVYPSWRVAQERHFQLSSGA